MDEYNIKPSAVVNGIRLLYSVLVIDAIYLLIRTINKYSSYIGAIALLVLSIIFLIIIMSFLIHKISLGRNWARITYLVLTIISFPSLISSIFTVNFTENEMIMLSIFNMIVRIIALVMLFSSPSNEWFKQQKNIDQGKIKNL